ncbi:DUF6734 family protein [uncultured Flavobacterium sp.]|uniref:DUF6734 family protein n=1 Tax=uncultured Flavobacterium sp. TaxID=165435 RepID=UPI0025E24C32|nr:DUF6734 family protein [uncultured Flavobacterium sp.]
MKIVYSYWNTGSGLQKPSNWFSSKLMLSSMVISVLNSYKHYGRVEMVTDSVSKIWIEKLGLPFESIKTDLDELQKYDKGSWALGKIKAYSIQKEPFLHVDLDVILFEPFSKKLITNDLYVQNIEPFHIDTYHKTYMPYIEMLENLGTDLPFGFSNKKQAVNLGIYGCNNLEFNKLFCDSVFTFMDHNEKKFKSLVPLHKLCVVWEQYFWAVIADQLKMTVGTIIDPHYKLATENGYTHLLVDKYKEGVADNFSEYVKNEYPHYYQSIEEVLKNNT